MFCKECIQEWIKKGKDQCPLCQRATNLLPLNRILRDILDQTLINGCPVVDCPMKSTNMTYEMFLTHLGKECTFVKVACPMNCGATFERSAWLHHFDQDCIKVEIPCVNCLLPTKRADFAGHNCMESLKKKVAEQQILIKQLQDQNAEHIAKGTPRYSRKTDK